mmetsp:Transcript_19504/g.44838  ORF Transcript_19504/g.44838 Transcript_19504/m.44838 type:complete len:218 (+) Transcript_19504:102-755(+)
MQTRFSSRVKLNKWAAASVDLHAPRLDHRPLDTLVVPSEHKADRERCDPLDSHQLALVRLRLGRPREERADVLGHLRCSSGSSVFILNGAVVQRHRHADPTASKVRVVVLCVARWDTRRRILVPGEERKDIIGTVVAGLHDEREVRRVGAVVGIPGSFLVGIRRREVIRSLARPLKHLALVVRTVDHVGVLCHGLDFFLRVAHIDQIAVRNAREAVA